MKNEIEPKYPKEFKYERNKFGRIGEVELLKDLKLLEETGPAVHNGTAERRARRRRRGLQRE